MITRLGTTPAYVIQPKPQFGLASPKMTSIWESVQTVDSLTPDALRTLAAQKLSKM